MRKIALTLLFAGIAAQAMNEKTKADQDCSEYAKCQEQALKNLKICLGKGWIASNRDLNKYRENLDKYSGCGRDCHVAYNLADHECQEIRKKAEAERERIAHDAFYETRERSDKISDEEALKAFQELELSKSSQFLKWKGRRRR